MPVVTATREAASSRPAQRRKTSRANDSKSDGSKSDGAVSARLFDADRTDQTLDFDEALARQVSKRQLLWIDVQGPVDDAVSSALAERLELKPSTRRIFERASEGAHVALHGSYLHLRVATEAGHDPSESPCWLDLIAAGNVVLTHHREPIRILAHLDERIETDTTIGTIDAAAFVATAVDAAVTSYFEAVDAIEDDVDRLDGRALGTTSHEDVLAELVQLRRRVARLRRVLSDQREVFAAFAAPDFGVVAPGEDAAAFQAVAARFEDALRSVEDSRDLLIGSFDVFMTRTAQRTNEVMKVLALATVLLLPGSLIAGLLGMNVVVPLPKDDPMSFWLVVAAILVLAGGVLALARVRRWI
jgi:Mg2+ and Co2+ transporter CorA